ncbi:MAG: DUF2905 domain-containing protein [Pseudomonadales bacterium]
MNASIGNWLIILGCILLVGGLIIKLGFLSWLGHLPGDFHIKREGFQFFFPFTSMVIISLVLSAIISVVRKLL